MSKQTETVIKRICENRWHGDIELKPLELCPRCRSEAYHLVITIKNEQTENGKN